MDITESLHKVVTAVPLLDLVVQKQYPIPADLVRELLDVKERAGDIEMGEISLGLIASIWDGDFPHVSEPISLD